MAGHSKWANIKFRKAAQDAKRGKIFTKLIREITVAARHGDGDTDNNPRLRSAVDKALAANMTRDTIERAIKRGTGEIEGAQIEETTYEGYAPGGIALLVECATDNKNRTVSEVRHAFSKHGGNLGTDGSVAYLFNKIGSIVFQTSENKLVDEEQLMDIALDAGAEDIESEDGIIEIVTSPTHFLDVLQALTTSGLQPDMAELIQRPSTEVELSGEDAEKVILLIEVLEQLDDVQEVFSNASFVDMDNVDTKST